MKYKIYSLILLILAFVLLFGCSKPQTPTITEFGKTQVISIMKEQFPEIVDIAILQKDDDLSLAVIVPLGTSKETAKEIGTTFILLCDSFILMDETTKASEIPNSKDFFNYLVSVGTDPNSILVQGARAKGSSKIVW